MWSDIRPVTKGRNSRIEKVGRAGEEIAVSNRWPTLTFEGELTLDLGGKTIRWLHLPGHGAPLVGAARVRDWLAWQEGYLVRARDFARAGLAEGRSPEEIAEAADFAKVIGDRLPVDRHNMPRRHRDTVAKIAREISTK